MSFELDRLANQLDWNLLRTFMVIVQERSITAASQRLNVTQPSVSAALRRLEERLNAQLIERGSGRSFAITQAGEAVYREALEIYGGVVRLNDLNATQPQILSGNIVIYRSSHLDVSFLNQLMAGFQAAHPQVSFTIISAQCSDVVKAVEQRVASLGICTRVDPNPKLRKQALTPQKFGYFCGPHHQLFEQSIPDEHVLATSDAVAFEGETLAGALSQIARHRARNAIGDRVIATTSSIIDLVNMVRHGPVIAALSKAHVVQSGADLWRLPIPVPEPAVDAYAIVDTERHFTPAERAFDGVLEAATRAPQPPD